MQRKLISLVIILLLIFSLTECKKKIKDSMKNSHKKHKNHQEAHHFLTPDTLEFWLNALLATCKNKNIKFYHSPEDFVQV